MACHLGLLLICLISSGVQAEPITLLFENPPEKPVPSTLQANRLLSTALDRLGYAYHTRSYPPKRAIFLAENCLVDGMVHRVARFAQEHPSLIRVEAPVAEIRVAAYTLDPKLRLSGWESLRNTTLRIDYQKSIQVIHNNLHHRVSADHLSVVNSEESGLRKLLAGRSDLFVAIDEVADQALAQREFAGRGVRQAGVLRQVVLYPYLCQLCQRHRELAEPLAEALKAMREDDTP